VGTYRQVVVAVLVVALAAGVSGCSLLRGAVNQQLTTQENLANQRKVALQTIHDYPNPALESIRFTKEGHVDGSGGWSANAVVTIDGQQYQEILGTSLSGGDAVPTVPPGSISGPVTVTYSDGTSEVLK
jgi:hypothetical protein